MAPPSKKSARKKSARKKVASKKTAGKKAETKNSASKKKAVRKKARKSARSAKKPQHKKRGAKRQSWLRRALPWLGMGAAIVGVLGLFYTAWLDYDIRQKFEGKRWALPARVYSRPLELYPGMAINFASLYEELEVANYRRSAQAVEPGTFRHTGQHLRITTRAFQYWDEHSPSTTYDITLDSGVIRSIQSAYGDEALVRVDPAQVAAIYPQHQEDRDLVRLEEVPETLIQALLIIEDQKFFEHHGVRPLAIARAMLANIRAGKAVQGGSTLTQQLVKNYFLSMDRTITRKLVEAWMSVLLELHYDKPDILQAYLNEIFLGQDGERAIHGFGLASWYYFDKAVDQLSIEQQALLVAMVKGATYYNPRRHPQRATQRRNLVLDQLAKHGVISQQEAAEAKRRPLAVVEKPKSYRNRYLAFIDLVKRQLKRDYPEEDLNSEGLRIFTTLSPSAQNLLEVSITNHIGRLESRADVPKNSLQAAAVLTDARSGEVLALSGARAANDVGFNRALDARRQIGSLVKPAVYLTALMDSASYTPATLLDDTRFDHVDEQMKVWSPENYDKQEHGQVMLYQGLINSYNVATARLGLEIGLHRVSKTLRKLGMSGNWPEYPSMLLGAMERSPYDMAQIYQTFAGQGFYTPLRSVREVVTADGIRLQRYPLELEQRIDSNSMYLINRLLQKVAQEGTARRLASSLPGLQAAGKTGTTNDGRDTWFAGFSGEHLGVVWVGNDDNTPTALTGSSGALPIWESVFQNLPSRPYEPVVPQDIVEEWVSEDGLQSASHCQNAVQLPFIKGSEPDKLAECHKGLLQRIFNW